MKLLDKLAGGAMEKIADLGGKIIDKVTSDDDKLKAKKELSDMVMNQMSELSKMQSSVILSETKGNWLQRSWRPIVMLGFAFIVMYSKFIAPAFGLQNAELEHDFWTLLELGIGGYVIGRSAEKIAGKVTDNMDVSLLRKKDRKEALKNN